VVNTFYVWPKLLSAAYLFIAAGLVFAPRFADRRLQAGYAATAAVAAAFAFLAHGGAAFGILAIAGLRVLLRPRPAWPAVLAAILAAGTVYLPWSAYQAWVDPPGNRLLKWHLAGARGVDPQSLAQSLRDAYARPPGELVANKFANLRSLAGKPASLPQRLATVVAGDPFAARQQALEQVRGGQFLRLLESLALVLPPGLLALVLAWARGRFRTGDPARAGPELRAAGLLFACVGLGLALWVLILYGPGTTLLHQGSYFLPVALTAAAVLAAWSLLPAMAAILAAASCALQIGIYWIWPPTRLFFPKLPDALVASILPARPAPVAVGVSLLLAAALLAALWRLGRTAAGPAAPGD
jgi:hypothetical protein